MLKYMPIYGSILLTIIIVWIIASTIVGNRRKIRQAAAGLYVRSACCASTTTPFGWTQDGWVSTCDECGTWQYLGDDFDNPPPGFQDRHANSRRSAPRSAASEPVDAGASVGRLTSSEVTSGCELCGGELEHAPDCPRGIILDLLPDQDSPIPTPDQLPPPPNIGGEGHPDYQGPHYTPETTHGLQTRFVPYDVLRDPVEGAAVHIVGNAACVGPLAVERGRGDVDSIREEDES